MTKLSVTLIATKSKYVQYASPSTTLVLLHGKERGGKCPRGYLVPIAYRS